ncbi:hypothetical protein AB0J72_28325 [Dactylosporangium sp. NPDC049742]|uniref:hypothetical protein n=1 Tax=Dactylosporangium sp. NPDC049742 TaxID=3154737 RepID=UPI0034381A5E
MSEYDDGTQLDPGYTGDEQPDTYGGGDGGTDYGQYATGQDHQSLDQLHQVDASESSYDNQFNVYEQDHASAESTSFDQGHQVSYTDPSGAHYEESDFTSYDHSSAEQDHVFAAEGSESSHQAELSTLDSLREQLDSAFTSLTEGHIGGGDPEAGSAGLGVASN